MKEIIGKILGSLDTHTKNSYSARKLTAFVVIACVVAAHIKWIALGNFTQLEMVLTIDYGFAATLLGMTTYENLKKDKPTTPPKEDIRESFTNA